MCAQSRDSNQENKRNEQAQIEQTLQEGLSFWSRPIKDVMDDYLQGSEDLPKGSIAAYSKLLNRFKALSDDERKAVAEVILKISEKYQNDEPLSMPEMILLLKGYKEGIGVEENAKEADAVFKRAEAEDSNDANLWYEMGNLEKAAKLNMGYAYYELGMQELRKIADKNLRRFHHLLDEKIRTNSFFREVKPLTLDKDTFEQEAKAAKYFKKGGELGCADAYFEYAKYFPGVNAPYLDQSQHSSAEPDIYYQQLSLKNGSLDAIGATAIKDKTFEQLPLHLMMRYLNNLRKNVATRNFGLKQLEELNSFVQNENIKSIVNYHLVLLTIDLKTQELKKNDKGFRNIVSSFLNDDEAPAPGPINEDKESNIITVFSDRDYTFAATPISIRFIQTARENKELFAELCLRYDANDIDEIVKSYERMYLGMLQDYTRGRASPESEQQQWYQDTFKRNLGPWVKTMDSLFQEVVTKYSEQRKLIPADMTPSDEQALFFRVAKSMVESFSQELYLAIQMRLIKEIRQGTPEPFTSSFGMAETVSRLTEGSDQGTPRRNIKK